MVWEGLKYMDNRYRIIDGNRYDNGFTLVELLIVFLIIFMGLLGAWKLHINAVKATSFSNQMVMAANLIESFSNKIYADYVDVADKANFTLLQPVTSFKYCPLSDLISECKSNSQSDSFFKIQETINYYWSLNIKKIEYLVGWGGSNCTSSSFGINVCDHKIDMIIFAPLIGKVRY